MQVTALVTHLGVPGSFTDVVKKLWLMYISKIEAVDTLGERPKGDAAAASQQTANPSASANTDTDLHSDAITTAISVAEALYSQQDSVGRSNSRYSDDEDDDDLQLSLVDDSLTSLLQALDEDIARDEMEMAELAERQNQEQERANAAAQQQEMNTEETAFEPDFEELRIDPQKTSRPKSKYSNDRLVKHIEGFVHLEYLPAIIYLAFVWMRLPVMHADLLRLLGEERIPYASAHQLLPESIVSRLGKGFMAMFVPHFTPTLERFQATVRGFESFYRKHYSLAFAPIDGPVLVLSFLRRLNIGIALYEPVMRLLELTGENTLSMRRKNGKRKPEVRVLAAIVVMLKLHYGLDEIERQQPTTDEDGCINLPPLNEFLSQWRQNWERQLAVSAIPDLTAAGSHWESEFAQYCRRRMTRPRIPDKQAAYRDIAGKYRRIVDSLALKGQFDLEQARQMLPEEYARRFGDSDDQSAQTTERRDLLRQLEPVHLSLLDTHRVSGRPDRVFDSVAEPFDNHPEITLQRGELYAAIVKPQSNIIEPGYLLPVFGLVVARCAWMLGCTKQQLCYDISSLEFRLHSLSK
ncbi:hypothetical protein GGI15_002125 [Coemansia interrupta]|uniref:Uncharacterized protein n=1 Tax=Coemansia interrupta TaxID=1126814 RepID=A0A9W8LM69_9FUNG|nr:hypothetical protein GGI15_002125 [Coemansia interrupta]